MNINPPGLPSLPLPRFHGTSEEQGSFCAHQMIEYANAAKAALQAEIEQLRGIIERDQAAAPDLMFLRLLGAALRRGELQVAKRDVLEIALPPQGVSYNIEVEEHDQHFVLKLVEHKA